MGLIVGQREIGSRAFYDISFDLEGQNFSLVREGCIDSPPYCRIEDPKRALYLVNELKKRNLSPNISRGIFYDSDGGYIIKKSEVEDITSERLEEIVRNDEQPPVYMADRVLAGSSVFTSPASS